VDVAAYESGVGAGDGDAARVSGRGRGVGWDEAFVGADTEDPEALARDVRIAVARRPG